jgi:small-conductance mechanosensitive channel
MAAQVWQSVRPYLTDVLYAAALVLLGSMLGRLLETVARRAAQALLDRLGSASAGAGAIGAATVARAVPVLVGRFVYWLLFIVAAAAAIQVFGFPIASRAGARLVEYLPGVLTALAILFVGVVVASLAGGIAAAAAASAGTAYAGALGRMVQGILLVISMLVALEQLGVHGGLLVQLLTVVIGVGLAGAALAFGLGAKTAVSNIVGAYYVAQTYRVGQTVRVRDFEGRIVRTTATTVVLDNKGGQVTVPARLFAEEPSILITEMTS